MSGQLASFYKKVFFLMVCFLPYSTSSYAEMARMAAPAAGSMVYQPPIPPENNPHPPQTPEERTRVEFAESAIRIFLRHAISANEAPLPFFGASVIFQDKDGACLYQSRCYRQDAAFMNELATIHQLYGEVTEIRHAHIIPWSWQQFRNKNSAATDSQVIVEATVKDAPPAGAKPMAMVGPALRPDEYMVHAYVLFNKDGRWHHLDIILTEDEAGRPALRHFFTMPIPQDYGHMPPGVVC